MKMVSNPGKVFRSYSLWSMVAGLFVLAQEFLPFWEPIVDEHTFSILGAVALSLGVLGRFISQGIGDGNG